MSINWVMLSPATNPPFTPLPGEQVVCVAPGKRIGFDLSTPKHYPGRQAQPYGLSHSNGSLYITNRRVIYLPDKPTERFKSFAVPILDLQDAHVSLPWFSANTWNAAFKATSGGGIPPSAGILELKFTLRDAGVSDFHSSYERIKERLMQAVDVSNLAGNDSQAMNRMDVSNVNLDELPAYTEESDGPLIPPTASAAAIAQTQHQRRSQQLRDSGVGVDSQDAASPKPQDTPHEPPPDYAETQMAGLQDAMDRGAERSSER
ncbi:hypothetical protein DOTSEDRAFT_150592 [Dothistroma septosporum NZE10]|uniref:GRAM domain-containing protein n=1 Tax=Dothistroma septosporum (strain NZE10 / CBS 128990) TaxID=675120 RepID=N1PQ36_DOTSN|nr:hypothetical protein DOTSEDRAFT_150592 [Dothistroma septosporum NZE10]